MTAVAQVAVAPPRALVVARGAALVGAVGAAAAPPLASAALAMMLVAYALLPDAVARLQRVLREPLGRGWLVFVAALLLGTLVGAVLNGPAEAVRALYGWRHLLLIPVGLALFDAPAARLRFALGFVAFAVVAAVAATVMWKLGVAYKEGHAAGVLLRNSVTQSMVFAVGAYLALLLAATRAVQVPVLRVVLGVVALGLMAQLLFVQEGRSAHLALAAMLVVSALLLLRGRRRLAALLAVVLLAAAAFAASNRIQERFRIAIEEMHGAATLQHYTSMGIRLVIWDTTWDLVRERPWLGHGLGGLAPAYAARIAVKHPGEANLDQGWRSFTTTDPHNQYLFLWVEAGLAGLLAFGVLLLSALRQPAPLPWRAAGLSLLAAWCLTSLFSSHFQTFNEGTLIALFTGVLLARESLA